MRYPEYRRAGTHWLVSDGYIWDDQPVQYRRESGRPLECSSQLFVFNPQDRTANVTARFYHTDRPPTAITFAVAPGQIETRELAALSEIPHRQSFWIAVESDIPVLPQARHEDFTSWDPVPDALVAVAPYPGPLEDETAWVIPDCYQSSGQPWYEREMLTICNPNPQPVKAQVRYLLRKYALGGEEEIQIPGERIVQLEPWERFPRLIGMKDGPPVRIVSEYAVRIEATGPVIPQTTRRARWAGRASIIGTRSTMGFPLRRDLPERWYYPGGDVVDRGILPRARPDQHPLSQCDNDWNLLFINNLDATEPAKATVTFHKPDGSHSTSEPLEVPPLKSIIECLHGKPWLGTHTKVEEPFALTVTADRPVVPEICGAEFEMWSQVCPGAMIAVNFYPGPLEDEQVWWLGIGQAGGADEKNTEWGQWYHLFNPGPEPVRVTLSFWGLGEERAALTKTVEIVPGGVARVAASEIAGLPQDRPFAVRAEGDRPFCPQVFGRTFTRGLPHTRAVYSFIGVPLPLGAKD